MSILSSPAPRYKNVMSLTETVGPRCDNRRVVLIKSQRTNNRFYALVDPDSGIRNADIVPDIPPNLLLGIAYPCLEDGLNDFAVIRTTFETLDFFPQEDEMRSELMDIVDEARGNLVRRLEELSEAIRSRRAHLLGSNLDDFKSYALDIVYRGYPRRNLDSMMKLNVFSAVAEHDGHEKGSEPLYFYELRNPDMTAEMSQESSYLFTSALFDDVLSAVKDEANYESRYTFDRNVFQKFIALMFINYATTDPIFYGTNKADYGVSSERDMGQTPLYMAVGRELRSIETRLRAERAAERGVTEGPEAEIAAQPEERFVQLPGTLYSEDVLTRPIAAVCALAEKLAQSTNGESAEMARALSAEMSRLVHEMRELGVLSPFALDPGTPKA